MNSILFLRVPSAFAGVFFDHGYEKILGERILVRILGHIGREVLPS
jgi:hypothetical protein